MENEQIDKKEKVYKGLGVAGFVLSIIGVIPLFGLWGAVPLTGLILSGISLSKKRTGINTAGLVLGIIGCAWRLAMVVFAVLIVSAI